MTLRARRLLSPFLLVAIALVLGLALSWHQTATHAARGNEPARTAAKGGPGEVGRSDRIYLTASESAAAAQRGLLPPRTRSIIATRGPLRHGEWRWADEGVPPGPIAVRVDLGRQLVSVFRGRDEIGTAVIVYGAKGKETPRGKLPIRGKTRDYHSRTYDAPMPYSLWLREDGVALHGSSVTMGKATNGCIGVPVPFAQRLFAVAKKGDIIEVIG
jgi:hypothetical protein